MKASALGDDQDEDSFHRRPIKHGAAIVPSQASIEIKLRLATKQALKAASCSHLFALHTPMVQKLESLLLCIGTRRAKNPLTCVKPFPH